MISRIQAIAPMRSPPAVMDDQEPIKKPGPEPGLKMWWKPRTIGCLEFRTEASGFDEPNLVPTGRIRGLIALNDNPSADLTRMTRARTARAADSSTFTTSPG